MKKYNIIYADPAWTYDRQQVHTNSKDVCMKYNTMTLNDMKSLNIESIRKENCILIMWVTFPKLREGLELISSWGFEYKTNLFTWIKKNKKNTKTNFWGMGRYTRSNAEICLIATRGNPLKVLSHSIHSVIESPIREHSRKPDEVRDKIVELFGDLPRIELFARTKTEGWDVWGNEVKCDANLFHVMQNKKQLNDVNSGVEE